MNEFLHPAGGLPVGTAGACGSTLRTAQSTVDLAVVLGFPIS